MMICLCNGLNEASLREAAGRAPSPDVEDVYRLLGHSVECGTCCEVAQGVIAEARGGCARQLTLAAE